MAGADSPLHAVEMTGAPESSKGSKGSKGEILEATEYEWKLRTKRMSLAMKERTKRMKEEIKKWIPKKIFRHGSRVDCCAVTPDGKCLVTGGNDDGRAILWSLGTGELIRTFKGGHAEGVSSVCISGDHLVTGSVDNTAILWSLGTGDQIRTFKGGHTKGVSSVCVSGDHLVVGGYDKAATLWSLSTGELIRTLQLPACTLHIVTSVCISGDHLVAGLYVNTAILWSLGTGELIRKFEGHTASVMSVSVSGDHLVTGSRDNTAILWSLGTGELIRVFKGHTANVNSVCISSDYLVTGSDDKTAILWSLGTGDLIRVFKGRTDHVSSVCISGDHLVTGSDHAAVSWGSPVRAFTISGQNFISVSGDYLITRSDDEAVILSSSATGEQIKTFEGHTGVVTAACISGDHLITGSRDNTAILWSLGTGELIRTFEGFVGRVSSLYISGDYLVVGCWEEGSAVVYSVNTGEQIWSVGCSDASCVFGDHFVVRDSSQVCLLSLSSGKLIRVFEGHTANVNSVCISGDYLVTGSDDKTAILWSFGTGELIRKFEGHTAEVWSVYVSGDYLVTGSNDKTAIMWSLVTGEQKKSLRLDNNENLFSRSNIDCVLTLSDRSIFTVDAKYNLKSCFFDFQCASDFNTRTDRPDLILSKVQKELQPTEVDLDFTFWKNDQLLIMREDDYLVKGARGYEQGGVFNYTTPVYPLKTFIIPVENIAGVDSQFLELIVKHAEALDEYDVFKNEVVQYVVNFKWNTFVKRLFLWDFALTVSLFILYIAHSILFDDYVTDGGHLTSFGMLLMALCFLLSCYFLYHEFRQILKAWELTVKSLKKENGGVDDKKKDPWSLLSDGKEEAKKLSIYTRLATCSQMTHGLYENYFNDIWNMIHLSTNALIIATLIEQAKLLSNKMENTQHTIVLSSIIPPLLATELMFYLSGLRRTGPLIRMIIKIIKGIDGVLIILALMVVSFAGSYTIQFQKNRPSEYDGYPASLMSCFGHLFGNYDVGTIDLSSAPRLSKFQLSIFLVFVVIVVLNLLIALMGNIYAEVQANAKAESTFGIAKLVVEYEGLMSLKTKEKHQDEWFPAWLYILKKDVEEDSGDKIEMLRKENLEIKREVGDLKAQCNDMKVKIDEMLTILKNK